MSHIEPFTVRELGPKDWGFELLVAHTEHYTGKVMFMKAGHGGPLQYHEHKDETFYLYSGEAVVRFDRGAGQGLEARTIYPGTSIHIPPGAIHQVEALSDCVMFEASTPAFDDRVNVEARYAHASQGVTDPSRINITKEH